MEDPFSQIRSHIVKKHKYSAAVKECCIYLLSSFVVSVDDALTIIFSFASFEEEFIG